MKQGCSVFVGNIDFDVDEQKVIEELSAVGKVVSFRMMYDKNTGKSKGIWILRIRVSADCRNSNENSEDKL
ncbi:uncharacterized protein VICG_01784 [Vittaforma corneae ATCC 50505]|uniref:RRM domain-containing protein n=1 Tax=Vittaforma corneae (strain ATCC 50505) TaxID=993615 RepID=L2GL23_VITCO|nr:uncharacterized protein VICG_01784 [Vittaforma corneae ATCC 50505]ELA41185.1 hypothetical protein VICG_01784 [Vittaforma corneae ATCC 50505]